MLNRRTWLKLGAVGSGAFAAVGAGYRSLVPRVRLDDEATVRVVGA